MYGVTDLQLIQDGFINVQIYDYGRKAGCFGLHLLRLVVSSRVCLGIEKNSCPEKIFSTSNPLSSPLWYTYIHKCMSD